MQQLRRPGVTSCCRGALRLAGGCQPKVGVISEQEDDLHREPTLGTLRRSRTPVTPATTFAHEALRKQASAHGPQSVLSIAGSLTERATNATDLSSHGHSWQAMVNLSLVLNLGNLPAMGTELAPADAAVAWKEQAQIAGREAIHRAWSYVRRGVASSHAASTPTEVCASASASAAGNLVGNARVFKLIGTGSRRGAPACSATATSPLPTNGSAFPAGNRCSSSTEVQT